jgi:hypothetical protein
VGLYVPLLEFDQSTLVSSSLDTVNQLKRPRSILTVSTHCLFRESVSRLGSLSSQRTCPAEICFRRLRLSKPSGQNYSRHDTCKRAVTYRFSAATAPAKRTQDCSGGTLEPAFRVLFSAIFHGVALESANRVENTGRQWKQKPLQTAASLRTFFVLVICAQALKSLFAFLGYSGMTFTETTNAGSRNPRS